MALFEKGKIFAQTEKEGLLFLQSGFGRKADGKLVLHPFEAAYSSKCNLVKTFDGKKELDEKSILKKSKESEGEYLIYKKLRSGGRIVRFSSHSPKIWRVYSRGVGREQERPQMLVRIVDSKWKTSLSSFEKELSVARLLRLELVLAYLEGKEPKFIKLAKQSFE